MSKNKARCNMYLDQKSVGIVKNFLKDTGLTLSAYLDLLICSTAQKIQQYQSLIGDEVPADKETQIFYEHDDNQYFNIFQAHKILGLTNLEFLDLNESEEDTLSLSPSQAKRLVSGNWKLDTDKNGRFRVITKSKKKTVSLNEIK